MSRIEHMRITHQSVKEASLDPWPLTADQIREGNPEAAATIIWKSEDGTLCAGIWECTPGTFDWEHVDETMVVVSGRATIASDGEEFEVAVGDIAFFPAGTKTQWTIHETIRKAFHLHAAGGLGL